MPETDLTGACLGCGQETPGCWVCRPESPARTEVDPSAGEGLKTPQMAIQRDLEASDGEAAHFRRCGAVKIGDRTVPGCWIDEEDA